jgi:DNA-3-methyladenine glycosylase
LKKLAPDFYNGTDVVMIARQLLGKILVTQINGSYCSGRIVETEAYVAFTDRASHSYAGRRTARNEHMYAAGGTAYVYICYGMHHLFNVVTNKQDVPDAVLIRALHPLDGIDTMLLRTGKKQLDNSITRGPGNLSRAMGISKIHSGVKLEGDFIYLAADDFAIPANAIAASKRIGIDGAGNDSLLPYRFYLRNNPYVSARPVN